ncbi:MAG: PQQ-binding-like beta-propeller repeat protein [Planctomycetes bacterium]|nr:PQQ-binding-like beta-propeller repeat protein [Planctomycetota bacterium]
MTALRSRPTFALLVAVAVCSATLISCNKSPDQTPGQASKSDGKPSDKPTSTNKTNAKPDTAKPNTAQPDTANPTPVVAKKSDEPAPADQTLDWTNWRGPEQNGISRETGLVANWNPEGGEGSNLLWRSEALATRSTPIVMKGKLYTLARHLPGTTREAEKVICADAATGEVLWENIFNVFLSDVPAERVGWSCVAGDPAEDRVYALGVCGYFQCIDAKTGKTVWSHSMSEEFGLLSTYGGRTNTPVIFEDTVIISGIIIGWGKMAKPSHGFICFDKHDGQVRWFRGTRPLPYDTTYSTPTLTAINGQMSLVFGSGDGAVWSLQPRTGKEIWHYQFSRRGLNVSPLVVGDRVYTGHSEENVKGAAMGAMVAIDASGQGDISESGTVWLNKKWKVGKSSPVLVDGRLYACEDGGKLRVIDAASGKLIGRRINLLGSALRASPLYADGKLYVCTTEAWHVFEPTAKGVKELAGFRLPLGEAVHGSPIVSHGRIYLPTTVAMYCIGKTDQQPAATKMPAPPKETAADIDQTPTQLQIVPAEVLLKAGAKQSFKVRLYNKLGQFIKESEAELTLEGEGKIEGDTYVSLAGKKPLAAYVTAKVGELTGRSRIRVIPPLPWKFDFEDVKLVKNPKTGVMEGEPPIAWVGLRYRHKVRKVDGSNVLVKVDNIPKGTRSQGWMGIPDLNNYTMQADVQATSNSDNQQFGDIGMSAQRYTLDLMGSSQQVQLRSWVTQLERVGKSVPFAWKAGVWYTMKIRVETDGKTATIRGKVWNRDEAEPAAWTIEAIDEAPNLVGSPGLFGSATNAEFYMDNITVTPN